MNVPNLRPLSFGEILDGGFTLYRRNFVTFALTSLIMALAMVAALIALAGATAAGIGGLEVDDLGAFFGAMFGFMLILGVVMGLLMCVLWNALTREASQAYIGEPTSIRDGLGAGFRGALRVFLSGMVATVMMVVALLASSIVLGIVQTVIGSMGAVALVLAQVLSFLVTLALYLAAMAAFFAVVPAIVVEGKGPVDAISRSIDLARGAPLQVVGVMVVTFIISYLPILAVVVMTGGLAAVLDRDSMPSMMQFVAGQLLAVGVGILTTPFFCAVMVLLYYDRRVRTEALDVQILADRLAVL